ncbi:MAG: hypothetical protein IJT18_02180 [Oscillospiraceae bacterium]|nr:hypothetical protein [Oscillospiraceae bacterium]
MDRSGLPSFTEEDVKRVLGTAEGRTLLKLLNRDGGALLRQAAEAVKTGDTARAQALLRPTMESPEIAALIEKINGKQE